MSAAPSIGFAIPAYSNVNSLRRALRSIARFAPDLPVIVVDDSGSGKIAAALQPEFPAVVWKVHDGNQGFGRAATSAVFHCPAEIVILLNDDVELLNDPCPTLLAAFATPTLFAATFRSQTAAGVFREGAKRLVWPLGLPRILHNEHDQHPPRDGVRVSDYAVGGHAAYNRQKFLDLGGFDPLFDPFYWEDVDLCARAAQNGWLTTYLEAVAVRHDEHGAIRSTFDAARIREITLRNRLLFAWRHMPSHLWPLHVLTLIWELLLGTLTRRRVFPRAFRAAWQRRRFIST